MATVQNLVDRSMRLIGNLEPGTSGTAAESADALTALNAMLASWRNSSLMCYAMQDQSIPLVATNSTRTIGPSGNLITTRPTNIETAYVIVGTLSYPVEVITAEEFALITIKTLTNAWPYRLWYQPNIPDGTINLWPVPDASSTLHVITRTPVNAFAALTDVVSLPPGYEDAICFNLAVYMAPEYEREPSKVVTAMAKETIKILKRTNNETPRMYFDYSLLGRTRIMTSNGNFYP